MITYPHGSESAIFDPGPPHAWCPNRRWGGLPTFTLTVLWRFTFSFRLLRFYLRLGITYLT
jgi:hypothetical protein